MARFRFSVSELQQGLLQVLQRFPLAVIFSVIAFYTTILLIRGQEDLVNHLLVCLLGLPLTVAFTIIAESFNWKILLRLAFQVLLIALLVIYYFTLPTNLEKAPMVHIYRYIGLLFAAHLLVAISVIGFRNRQLLFWYFNQYMFFRWLQASLFSSVLYAGIAGAIVAVHFLFNLDIDDKVYGYLYALVACIFHPLYFLAGIPVMQHREDDEQISYPKQLSIFSIYILLPIVLIYLLILYAYGVKIIFTFNWPIGWVAWLVLGFSVSGIFAWLLVYPLQQTEKQTLAKLYYRYYFLLLIPVLILLYLAIFKRLNMYGFTEDRYIILISAFWLTVVCVYNFLRKGNLIFIPTSLLIVTVISISGPWSMFSVSRTMQLNRLQIIFETNNMLNTDGKIPAPDTTLQSKLTAADRFEITSITKYLCEMHGIGVFEKIFVQPIDSMKDKRAWWQSDYILEHIGIKPQYSKDLTDVSDNYHYISLNCENEVIDINGYSNCVRLTSVDNNTSNDLYSFNNVKDAILIIESGNVYDTIDLKPWLNSQMDITGNYKTLAVSKMTFSLKNNSDAKLVLQTISGQYHDKKYEIHNIEALLFFNKYYK